MKTSDTKLEQGTLLISEPFLRDYYFSRSVILLAEHDSTGSFGIILNKPVEIKINEIITDFPRFDADLYLGGPKRTDSLFVLHTLGKRIDKSTMIMPGLYWGGDIDMIKSMIEDKLITKNDIRFYFGYSEWDAEELNREMSENSWVVAQSKSSRVLFESPESMWKNLLKSRGDEYAMWVNYPLDPMMN